MSFTVRDFKLEDLPRIKEIHEASGLDYRLPDLRSPLFLVTKVVESNGEVKAAAGAYLQVELYLWLDHTWSTPKERFEAIYSLDVAGMGDLWLKGIECACLWLPPELKRFEKRLAALGFMKDRDGWQTFSKSVLPKLY